MATLERDRVLAPLTTMGVGGPSDAYLNCESLEDLRSGVDLARAGRVPLLILGGGSNMLISDEGFRGLVLRPGMRELRSLDSEGGSGSDTVLVRVGAGEPWDGVVQFTVESGWAGLEPLSGIPGLAGASPIQNIGAYGQEVARVIEVVEALDLESGMVVRIPGAHCGFAYRDSRFKSGPDAGRYVVLAVEFRLRRQSHSAARYGELRSCLSEAGHNPDEAPLSAIRQAVLELRRSKGMVWDPGDRDSASCGSFFTNPILDADLWPGLVASWRRDGRIRDGEPDPPRFEAGPGRVKTSAAWLIERAGFGRGYAIPGARPGAAALSSKHCLALTNQGQALAREIWELAREIHRGVQTRMGVTLVPEPVFVGLPDLAS